MTIMHRWNVVGAIHKPNDIIKYMIAPHSVMKIVLCLLSRAAAEPIVSTIAIHKSIHLTTSYLIQHKILEWQWKRVFDCLSIQLPIIYTDPLLPIFPGYNHD